MPGTIMPSPWFTGFDDDGHPLVGGLLYTYAAGTDTPLATYSDVDLTTANANPVELDGGGRATVYLIDASYKFVLKDEDDVTIRTQDFISGAPSDSDIDIDGVAGTTLPAGSVVYLNNGSGALIAGRWYLADSDLTYASSLPLIGMAPTAIESGTTGNIRLQGRVVIDGPVVAGGSYYVGPSPGILSATAGANSRVVGVADSTTSIVIAPNPPPPAASVPYVYTYEAIPLADGATIALDCAASDMDGTKYFYVGASGNRTLLAPTNAQVGMRMILAHIATGADRTLTLTGGAGGFRFGTDITALTATASGKTDFIGVFYDGTYWDVVAYVKGY